MLGIFLSLLVVPPIDVSLTVGHLIGSIDEKNDVLKKLPRLTIEHLQTNLWMLNQDDLRQTKSLSMLLSL